MTFTNAQSVERYLDEIPKFKSTGVKAAHFNLSQFKDFCAFMGNPQEHLPAIHVGGTNGKGSTCQILRTVYENSGYCTGLYTSPHIMDFKERFRIGDQYIPDEDLILFFNKYADHFKQYNLSYFEITTALAFWWFERKDADLAIIEVGLGGRLDATNVITPLVSVITSVGLDHTDILGETLEEVAAEKAGIIKNGRPVVIGDLPKEARNVIRQQAKNKNAELLTIDRLNPQHLGSGHYQFVIEGKSEEFPTNLTSPVQAKNLAVAWRVIEALNEKYRITKEQFREAVSQVDLGFGRFEKLTESQCWYFDGGHNLEAVRALKQTVKTIGQPEDATLVLAMMGDKVRPEVMEEFSEFKNIYYYPLALERAASFDDIKQWLPQVKPFPENGHQQLLLNDFDSELVIFAGSFYFYETVRDWVSSIA